MQFIWLLSALNLALGVASIILVARHRGVQVLLSPGRQPLDGMFWGSMLLTAAGVLLTFSVGPLMLLLVLAGVGVWLVRVAKYPRRVLGNLGGRALVVLSVMFVGGLIGAVVFDWLRFGQDLDYPQALLMALLVLSILLLMIQRAILIAVQLHLWACVDAERGGSPVKALLLGLFTAYFGLFYALLRAQRCEREDDRQGEER